MEIINFAKKEMLPLTKEQQELQEESKVCCICKRKFIQKYSKDKKYHKVRDHCHYTTKYIGAAHNICNLKYTLPDEIPTVFHNGSKYVYYFIIKELANESSGLSRRI